MDSMDHIKHNLNKARQIIDAANILYIRMLISIKNRYVAEQVKIASSWMGEHKVVIPDPAHLPVYQYVPPEILTELDIQPESSIDVRREYLSNEILLSISGAEYGKHEELVSRITQFSSLITSYGTSSIYPASSFFERYMRSVGVCAKYINDSLYDLLGDDLDSVVFLDDAENFKRAVSILKDSITEYLNLLQSRNDVYKYGAYPSVLYKNMHVGLIRLLWLPAASLSSILNSSRSEYGSYFDVPRHVQDEIDKLKKLYNTSPWINLLFDAYYKDRLKSKADDKLLDYLLADTDSSDFGIVTSIVRTNDGFKLTNHELSYLQYELSASPLLDFDSPLDYLFNRYLSTFYTMLSSIAAFYEEQDNTGSLVGLNVLTNHIDKQISNAAYNKYDNEKAKLASYKAELLGILSKVFAIAKRMSKGDIEFVYFILDRAVFVTDTYMKLYNDFQEEEIYEKDFFAFAKENISAIKETLCAKIGDKYIN